MPQGWTASLISFFSWWYKENRVLILPLLLKSNSFVGLLHVAESGLGLALLPCAVGDPSPHLVRADAFPEMLTTSVWVATHKDMIASPKVQSILTWFVEAIRREADLFEGRTGVNSPAG
jgi:DNA-binding transcriptional LysR family regulator